MADIEVEAIAVSIDGGESFKRFERPEGTGDFEIRGVSDDPVPYVAFAGGPLFDGTMLPALKAPARVSDPVISGNTMLGSTLTRSSPGVVTGNPQPQPGMPVWQWRETTTAPVQDIAGANGETFTPDDATFDAGHQIRTGTTFTNSQGEITLWSPWVTLTVQPTLQIQSVTPNPIVAGQPFTILFDVAPDTVTSNAPLTGTGLTRSGVGPSDPAVDVTITPAKAGYTTVPRVFDVVAAPDVLELTSREYPTDVGTITYNVSSQFSGTVTNWSVAGSPHATISNGVLALDTDDVPDGMLELEITATGAVKPVGKLTLFFSPITVGYDGEFISTISYPDDTPADVDITYTPVGGLHDGRVITFTPADLEGMVDGESFFALPPVVSISTDTAPTGSVNVGDVLSLDKPALQIFTGDTTPALIYSARGSNGWTMNNITFPWTVPAGVTGSLTIRAGDTHGNYIDSTSFPAAASQPLANGVTPIGAFDGGTGASQSIHTTSIDIGPADAGKTVYVFLIGQGTAIQTGASGPKLIAGGVEYAGEMINGEAQVDTTNKFSLAAIAFVCPAGGQATLQISRQISTEKPRGFVVATKGLTRYGFDASSWTMTANTPFGEAIGATQVGDIILRGIASPQSDATGLFGSPTLVSEIYDQPLGGRQLWIGHGVETANSSNRILTITPKQTGHWAHFALKLRNA